MDYIDQYQMRLRKIEEAKKAKRFAKDLAKVRKTRNPINIISHKDQ